MTRPSLERPRRAHTGRRAPTAVAPAPVGAGMAVVALVYAAWCVIALVEIAQRQAYGASRLPGPLADHNGNIAISGFILCAAYPGAWLADLGRRRDRAALRWLGRAAVPAAALAWGGFFVLMELFPLYRANWRDWTDIPASLFGMACAWWIGGRFQAQIERRWGAPRR